MSADSSSALVSDRRLDAVGSATPTAWGQRQALLQAPITQTVVNRAVALHHDLARTGHYRLPIPDLLIAAAAEAAHFVVLHYDADFERIALVTGQGHGWV